MFILKYLFKVFYYINEMAHYSNKNPFCELYNSCLSFLLNINLFLKIN